MRNPLLLVTLLSTQDGGAPEVRLMQRRFTLYLKPSHTPNDVWYVALVMIILFHEVHLTITCLIPSKRPIEKRHVDSNCILRLIVTPSRGKGG